jgi:Zn-dependent M28 family amino/carboxypeptidase
MPRWTALALVAFTVAAASRAEAPPAFDPAITGPDFGEHVRMLASDEFAGRDPVTPGEDKTVAYLVAQLQRMGLEPGNGDSWTQAVPFQLRQADLRRSRADIAVGGRTLPLSLNLTAVLGSDRGLAQVEVAASPMVFLGYGIVAPEEGWDDFGDIDLTGKTAVFLAGEPDGKVDGRERFDGRRLTVHWRSAAKFEHAARHGATAALVIHDTQTVGYDWKGVQLRWHNREFALRPADRSVAPVAVQGWLAHDAGRTLFKAAGLDLAKLSAAAAQPGFRAVPMGDAAFNATLHGKVLVGESRNVVARLPGATRPDEAVLYTAHWDHLGTMPGKSGDAIYNGALDNASGVAAVLEVAGRFAHGPRPARSVVFLFPTLEEVGLVGSQYYAAHPVVPLARTVADLNFDMVVPIGPPRNYVVVGLGMSELDGVVTPVAQAHGRAIDHEPDGDNDHFLRSDHVVFARAGVPVLYLRGGTRTAAGSAIARTGGATEGAWRENAAVYHTTDDEYDASWDLDGVTEDVTIAYEIGAALADGEDWPNYRVGTAFRHIREASRRGEADSGGP